HREGVAAIRARTTVVVDGQISRGFPEGRVLRRRHPFRADLRDCRHRETGDGGVAGPERFAQPLHLLLALEADGIVGLDAEHKVHAALEIQPELELFRHQPRRRGDAVLRRDDRIHTNRGKDHEYRDDGNYLPANVLVHDEVPLPAGATGSCPWKPTMAFREMSTRTRSAI